MILLFSERKPDILNEIVLSPNPVQQDLTLTFPVSLIGKKSTLRLISQNGKTIWQNQHVINSTVPLPTNSLTAGLYLIKVEVSNLSRTLKFVKQ